MNDGQGRWGRHHPVWVLVTLALGVALTLGAVLHRERSNAAYVKAQFETESRDLTDAIMARFALYEYGLRSVRGLIQHDPDRLPSAASLERYLHSRELPREFPGARGFGYIARVAPEALGRHAAGRLARGEPPVYQLQPHEGERFVVEMIEPVAPNRAALGLDIASEPRRLEAARSAMFTGRATLTAPITIPQARHAVDRAFLLLLPTVRLGLPADSPAARESATFGWVYAPLLLDEVLQGLPLRTEHIALTLTDVASQGQTRRFFSTAALGPAVPAEALELSQLREPFGRYWLVHTQARAGYAQRFNLLPPRGVAWVGLTLTVLLALLQWAWLLQRQRRHLMAEQRAAERQEHEQRLLELNAGLEARVLERTRSLEAVEHFLRTVLDAVPSMISYWDRHQINRTANRANLEWRRPQGGTLVGQSVREVVGDALYAELRPHIEAVLRGEPRAFDIAMRSPRSGELRELRMRYLPDLRDGEVQGYYAVLDDVTELNRGRRALETALAVQATEHKRLQSIVQGTNVGTWEWQVQTGDCHYNERWAETLGHQYDELRPDHIRFWTERMHPDDQQRSQQALQRHFSGERAFYECQARMRHADGHWVWVLNRGQVRSWLPDGRPEWMYGTQQDISASKATENDLREAKRAAEAASQSKSAFLANMSHEIRTPLNAVLGVAHLLADSPLDDDQRGLLAKAQAAGRSLLGIVNDVLDLAKIEAGEMRLADEPFALVDLLREVESVYAVQAGHKGLVLRVECDPDLPAALQGDAARLRQVLVNLVGNSLKFTPAGSVVIAATVQTGEAGPRLRLSVRDSGIGITLEQQKRLFQPFTQADETTTRRFGGTGLGLSIVHRLVALMQGEVGLLSAPGLGSEFWLALPLREADPALLPVAVPLRSAASGGGLAGLRVLLVDDSEVNLEIARRMLEREGARVQCCGDGAQALERLADPAHTVDVVLMDVQMPVMDGLEATRRIRADERLAGLPVIALTAGALADERRRALDAGFSDFVAKPLDPAVLLTAVRRACPAALASIADRPAAAEAALASTADWPVVEGVDALRAQRQLGGDAVLFQRTLMRLLAERPDWAALPPAAPLQWTAVCADAWRARAHRLRGSAGMLGAQALARTATELETALVAGAAADAVRALAGLQAAFARLQQGAADARMDSLRLGPEAAPAEVLDGARWRDRLQQLAGELGANDLGASETFEALRASIASHLGADSAAAIGDAIAELDFAGALRQLEAALEAA